MEPAFLKITNYIMLMLIGFFCLPEIEDDTILENDRNEFLGINKRNN